MRILCFFSFVILLACTAQTQPTLDFTPMTLGGPSLSSPVDIVNCGDGSGRLFIVEKRGTVRIVQNNAVLTNFFLDIEDQVINSGERGLLGMAFHPDYPAQPYIYVNYVIDGTIINRISRFTLNPNDPNDINENTELILLEQAGVQSNHKAGDIAFGSDGYLYIGMGDGGGGGDPSNAGQNINTLLGKMLRIDVNDTDPGLNYAIPPDNPFVGQSGLDEIYMIGLRNPWRISFDSETGDLWIGDVGQNLWEEINMIPAGTGAGLNLGWDCREGTHNFEPGNCPQGTEFTDPIFEYPHSCSPCPMGQGASLTGGFVYRGDNNPVLEGCYVCADYISNYLWMIKQTGSNPPVFEVYVQQGNGLVSALVSFGEDDDGELYACNLQGILYQVSASGFLPIQWENVEANIVSGGNKIDWTLHQAIGVDHFEIQRSLESGFNNYSVIAEVQPVEDLYTYTYTDPFIQPNPVYYRIAAKMTDGSTEYSPFLRILPNPVSKPSLVYEPNSAIWRVQVPNAWRNGELTLYDIQGKEVFKKKISQEQLIELSPPLSPGCYFVTVKSDIGAWSDQLVW